MKCEMRADSFKSFLLIRRLFGSLMPYCFAILVFVSQMGYHTSSASGQTTNAGPVRETRSGSVQGYTHKLKSSGRLVERYLGVPYARPPVGDLRFKNPLPPSKWNGILLATKLPPACIQDQLEKTYILKHNPQFDGRMSEDCLYINIYVPHNTSQERVPLPVLVHVHGGSNMVGMGAMFHGDVLASLGNIIVVTFNYRLGPFGFLFMPKLGMMGNYGLFDQNLALHWVKANIAAFDGDPDRITIQGHSAGAVDVGLHVLSPLAQDLFQSAIMMSGSPTAYWAVTFDSPQEDDEGRRRNNLKMLGCDERNEEETINCLCKLSYYKLSNKLFQYKSKLYNFSPVVDGVYVLDHPAHVLTLMAKDAEFRPSCDSVMIGVTHDEGSRTADVAAKGMLNLPIGPDSKGHLTPPEKLDYWESLPNDIFSDFKGYKDIARYIYTPWQNESDATARLVAFSDFFGDNTFTAPAIKMADGFIGLKGSSVYVYSFNHVSAHTTFPAWMGVPHGEDQFYLFGSPVEDQELRNYTNEDVEVSQKLMQLWARFVYYQKNVLIPDESFQLPQYTADEKYLEISGLSRNGAFFEVKRRLRKQYTYFWNDVLPAIVSKQSSSNSEKDSNQVVLWVTTALLCIFVVLSMILLVCLIFHFRKKRGPSVKKQELIEDSANSMIT